MVIAFLLDTTIASFSSLFVFITSNLSFAALILLLLVSLLLILLLLLLIVMTLL